MGAKAYVSVTPIVQASLRNLLQRALEGADASAIPAQELMDGKFLFPLYVAMAFSSVALLGKSILGRAVPLNKMHQV